MNVRFNVQSHNIYSEPKFNGTRKGTAREYEAFYRKITDSVNKNYPLAMDVHGWFFNLAKSFERNGNLNEFTKLSKSIIEFLVSKEFYIMAGMFCSTLIKLNRNDNNMRNVEDLAVRALAIAKRSNDIVHIAARANDINMVLRQTQPGSDRHLKHLRIQNDALENICENYDKSIKECYQSSNKDLTPLENYEHVLLYTKLEIAKHALLKEPGYAKMEFKKAKEMYEKQKGKYSDEMTEKIDKKIDDIEKKMKILNNLK